MPTLDLSNLPDATLVAHYRAEDYTDSGSGAWPDRTANGHDLAEATNYPAAVADGGADFNNKPVVRFDGTNDILTVAMSAVAQPVTMILIAKSTLANAAEKDAFTGRVSGGSNYARILWNASESLAFYAGATIAGTSGNGVPLVVDAFFSGSSSILRANGAVEASGNIGTAGILNGLSLGAEGGVGARPWGGDVAEALLISGKLTVADRIYLAQYAEQRYSIALPFPQTAAPTPTSVSSARCRRRRRCRRHRGRHDGQLRDQLRHNRGGAGLPCDGMVWPGIRRHRDQQRSGWLRHGTQSRRGGPLMGQRQESLHRAHDGRRRRRRGLWRAHHGGTVGSARRELEASSDNPSAFTLDSSENWGAAVVTVRPISAVSLLDGGGIMAAGL